MQAHITLQMTDVQLRAVDRFYKKDTLCGCGTLIKAGQPKGLLAQPNVKKNIYGPGKLFVVCLCAACFTRISKTLSELGHKF